MTFDPQTGFGPLIDYVKRNGGDPTIEDDLLVWDVRKDGYVNANGPDPGFGGVWGASIIDDGDDTSASFETVEELIAWLDKILNPSERDLNEAWGV